MATPTQAGPALPPGVQVLQIANGFVAADCIAAAARFRIADGLANGPRPVKALAEERGADAGALYRVLRALASLGVFRENPDGTFENTELSETLRTDVPGSVRAMVEFIGDEMHHRVYAAIDYSLRTGKPAFDHVYGKPPFQYLSETPEAAKAFDDAMASNSSVGCKAVAEAYDFSGRVVADIGGGNGKLLATILERYPDTRGILFDIPHAIQHARDGDLLPAGRYQLVEGDFFELAPEGADIYVLKHIIHDWGDEKARIILANCRRVMKPDAKLLIIELMIPGLNEPSFAKFLDVEMLLIPGGRERTAEEYGALLASAGLHLERTIPTSSQLVIFEARPV